MECTTGVKELDKLIGGVHLGDNLVWEIDSGVPVQFFISKYLRNSPDDASKAVFVSFNASPQTVLDRLGKLKSMKNLVLVDCFTSGKGNDEEIFARFYRSTWKKYDAKVIHVKDPSNPDNVRKVLNEFVLENNPCGRYFFDSLTGMLELWGSESSVLKFFTRSCPCLYDLKALAYWLLETKAHSETFLANIKHITQVIIELNIDTGQNTLAIHKAYDRVSPGIGVPRYFLIENDLLKFGPKIERLHKQLKGEKLLEQIGNKIKSERVKLDLSQRELAKRVNLSTGAISQIESGSFIPSLNVLLRIMDSLKMNIDDLLIPFR